MQILGIKLYSMMEVHSKHLGKQNNLHYTTKTMKSDATEINKKLLLKKLLKIEVF